MVTEFRVRQTRKARKTKVRHGTSLEDSLGGSSRSTPWWLRWPSVLPRWSGPALDSGPEILPAVGATTLSSSRSSSRGAPGGAGPMNLLNSIGTGRGLLVLTLSKLDHHLLHISQVFSPVGHTDFKSASQYQWILSWSNFNNFSKAYIPAPRTGFVMGCARKNHFSQIHGYKHTYDHRLRT